MRTGFIQATASAVMCASEYEDEVTYSYKGQRMAQLSYLI